MPPAPLSNPSPQELSAPQTQKPYNGDDPQEQLTKQTAVNGDLTLDDAIKMFDDTKTYVNSGHRTNWDNYFKVYKGVRVIRNYEGVSDPVIRESHTIIETLVANIAGGNPK